MRHVDDRVMAPDILRFVLVPDSGSEVNEYGHGVDGTAVEVPLMDVPARETAASTDIVRYAQTGTHTRVTSRRVRRQLSRKSKSKSMSSGMAKS